MQKNVCGTNRSISYLTVNLVNSLHENTNAAIKIFALHLRSTSETKKHLIFDLCFISEGEIKRSSASKWCKKSCHYLRDNLQLKALLSQ